MIPGRAEVLARAVTGLVTILVCSLAGIAAGDEAPSRVDPDRPALARPLPIAAPAPAGHVRVPRELALEAIREAEEEVAPDDRPGNPAYQPRSGPASEGP